MVEEIWKDVVGYEGLYEISNLGNLRSCGKYKYLIKEIAIKERMKEFDNS